METYPLWKYLKPEQLEKLIKYQQEKYGTKLDIEKEKEKIDH